MRRPTSDKEGIEVIGKVFECWLDAGITPDQLRGWLDLYEFFYNNTNKKDLDDVVKV